jgi:hypothetical protein
MKKSDSALKNAVERLETAPTEFVEAAGIRFAYRSRAQATECR